MPQSAEHLKEEGWIYQSCGFPLVATAPWGLPGLRSKGRAGAAGPEAHPCMKIFRDPGEKGDQNSGGGREKEGFSEEKPLRRYRQEQRWDHSTDQLYLSFPVKFLLQGSSLDGQTGLPEQAYKATAHEARSSALSELTLPLKTFLRARPLDCNLTLLLVA